MNETCDIFERQMVGIDRSGNKINIRARIGLPYPSKEFNSWACPVAVDGLYENLADQHGVDSWQAVRLSQKLVSSLLRNFVGQGGRLFLFAEQEEIQLDEINELF